LLFSFIRKLSVVILFSRIILPKQKRMKNTLAILSIVCALILVSCQTKRVEIKNESPNGKVITTIKASHQGIGTWKVELDVKAYTFKQGHLAFELETTDVSDKTVKFDWKDDRNCIISFDEPDGQPKKFQLIADESQVQLAEVSL
jgi:hypothetical protein